MNRFSLLCGLVAGALSASACAGAGGDEEQARVASTAEALTLTDGLMARYELLDEVDLPFPLGGCFGYWG
jgi:hypothetical protein